jgi:hypothetical protein
VKEMLSQLSKTNQWGCTACYNHNKKNAVDYCFIAGQCVELLNICPLGQKKASKVIV